MLMSAMYRRVTRRSRGGCYSAGVGLLTLYLIFELIAPKQQYYVGGLGSRKPSMKLPIGPHLNTAWHRVGRMRGRIDRIVVWLGAFIAAVPSPSISVSDQLAGECDTSEMVRCVLPRQAFPRPTRRTGWSLDGPLHEMTMLSTTSRGATAGFSLKGDSPA